MDIDFQGACFSSLFSLSYLDGEQTTLVKKSTRVQLFCRNVCVTMASYFCNNSPNVAEPAAFTIGIRAIASAVGSCENGRFCVLVTSFSERLMRVLFIIFRRLPSGCSRAMGTLHNLKERTSFKLTSLFFATSKRQPNNLQSGLMDQTLSDFPL